MDFAGESLIVDSDGNLIFKADDKEQLIVCNMDLKQAAASGNKRPYISLRRPDQYKIGKNCNAHHRDGSEDGQLLENGGKRGIHESQQRS